MLFKVLTQRLGVDSPLKQTPKMAVRKITWIPSFDKCIQTSLENTYPDWHRLSSFGLQSIHVSTTIRPLARTTLPALHQLIFEGADEYFDDLVARIDTPVIRELEITFFHRHLHDFSQLSQYIGRIEVFKSPAYASINLLYGTAEILVGPRTGTDERASLLLGISCDELHLQLRYFVQVCSSALLPFSNVESLAISSVHPLQQSQWRPSAEDLLWLDLLHPFSAVKALDIDENSLTPVAYTLKVVVKERITEILPAIRELSIGEHLPSSPIPMAIEKFATARGLVTRPDRPRRWVAG